MKYVATLLNEQLVCDELTVKEYLDILKCSFGDDPDKIVFVETMCDIFSKVAHKPSDYFKKISIVDFVLFLLDLRINCLGNSCRVSVTKDEKQMTLELNLNYVKDQIVETFTKVFNNEVVNLENVEITLGCPSIQRILEQLDDIYQCFITQVTASFSDKSKTIKIKTNNEAKQITDCLSPKLFVNVNKKVNENLEYLSDTNFLKSRYGIEQQRMNFVPTIENVIWYTQLIFNEPLDVFYDNIFFLSHMSHISPTCIFSLTPGEYVYMAKKLEKTLSTKNSNEQPSDGFDNNDFSDPDGF